jgi:hypothetical protein
LARRLDDPGFALRALRRPAAESRFPKGRPLAPEAIWYSIDMKFFFTVRFQPITLCSNYRIQCVSGHPRGNL